MHNRPWAFLSAFTVKSEWTAQPNCCRTLSSSCSLEKAKRVVSQVMPDPEADNAALQFCECTLTGQTPLEPTWIRDWNCQEPKKSHRAIYMQHACICMGSCRDSALWDRAKDHLKDTRVYQFCTTKVIPADSPSCNSARPSKKTPYTDINMATHSYESKEGVIEIVTDDFDKVGYTKADEADMTKQNKKQQFHVNFSLFSSIIDVSSLLIQASAVSISSPSFPLQPPR